MRTFLRTLVPLAVAITLAACGDDHINLVSAGSTSIDNGAIVVKNDNITLHPEHGPVAAIARSGDFSVDGKPVSVSAADRDLLLQYYAAAVAVREHGIETGRAGTGMAGAAIKDAVSSMGGDDDGTAGTRVKAQTDKVQQAAMKICDDLARLRTAQGQLAARLPAFQPYRNLISADSVDDCRKDD